MSVARKKMIHYLDSLLHSQPIADSATNGLQCEGSDTIAQVAVAVDATMETAQLAVANKCQLLIVHHGFIWGGLPRITDATYRFLNYVIRHELNIYASHLPLDCHPSVGNNICLAKMAKLSRMRPFGHFDGIPIGFSGKLPKPLSIEQLSSLFQKKLGGKPAFLSFGPKKINHVAIVSGKGSSTIFEAIQAGCDCLITGEPQYQDYHIARESGINLLFLGHYFSETVGVQAVGRLLKQHFHLSATFLDCPIWS